MSEKKVMIVKFNGGEVIIGKLDVGNTKEENLAFLEFSQSIILEDPRYLMIRPNQQEQTMHVSFPPVVFGAKPDKLIINLKLATAYTFDVEMEIEENYLNSVSPIKQPKKTILMPN